MLLISALGRLSQKNRKNGRRARVRLTVCVTPILQACMSKFIGPLLN